MWTIPSSHDIIIYLNHERVAFMEDQLQIAYLAGLFDGEGTITLLRHNRNEFKGPVMSMTSTTHNLLVLCQKSLGGDIQTQKVYKSHHKPSWSWRVRGNAALNAIAKLYPYLQEPEKKRRMQLILSTYKEVTPRNGKYSDELLLKKKDFEHEFFHPSNVMELLL